MSARTGKHPRGTRRARGRPPKSVVGLTRDRALSAALRRLDRHGLDALTFRALADDLGVSAMAVAHHVGSRGELLRSLVRRVYRGVGMAPDIPDPVERLVTMLSEYANRTMAHPNLAWAALGSHDLITEELRALTDHVHRTLSEFGVPAHILDTAVGCVMDYTHGFALAVATSTDASSARGSGSGGQALTLADYQRGLKWLLRP